MKKSIEIKNSGQANMTRSSLLERLTKTHISVPLSIFYGASILISIYSAVHFGSKIGTIVWYYFLGLFVFSFIEYMIHRYIFHMKTFTKLRMRFQYFVHGVHHEYPRDKERLAMPPLASVTIAIVLFSVCWTVGASNGLIFGSGFVAGYAFYLTVHYAVHAFRPPRNFLRILWKFHSIHHYKNHDVAYGVSSPFWDVIFRTLP